MQALGRSFRLGMLYDYRRDQLVAGGTLWDLDALEKRSHPAIKPYTECIIKTEKSLLDKTELLKVEGSLKLNFLFDIIDVSGSAEYVKNRKMTKRQERIIFNYSNTTRRETITTADLEKVENIRSKVLDQDIATHVVTEIVYGIDAFFEFNRTLSENENSATIHGKANPLLNIVEKFSASGSAELNMNNDEKNLAESLTCAFYGDLIPKTNPSTFDEALKLFKDLPTYLGENNEKAMPKRVSLYPLYLLNGSNKKNFHEIRTDLINKCASLINSLYELKIEANDLIQSGWWAVHPHEEHLTSFVKRIEAFETHVKSQMVELLPKIRGGDAEEDVLDHVLRRIDSSPFTQAKLQHWIASKRDEIAKLSYLIQQLIKNPEVDSSSDALNKANYNPQCVIVICLSIHLTSKTNPLLDDCDRYLADPDAFNEREETTHSSWCNQGVPAAIRENVEIFLHLVVTNVDDGKIKFVISHQYIDQQNNPEGIFLHVYERGRKSNVQIPSKPGTPLATKIDHDHICLTWDKPKNDSNYVKHYKIIWEEKHGKEWKSLSSTTSNATSVTINGLRPETVYRFKVQVIMNIGIAVESDMSDPIVTNPKSRMCTLC